MFGNFCGAEVVCVFVDVQAGAKTEKYSDRGSCKMSKFGNS